MSDENEQLIQEISHLQVGDGLHQVNNFLGIKGIQAIVDWHNKRVNEEVIDALWDLHEYMGQFPDDLNLAAMAERIKVMLLWLNVLR